MFGWFKKLVQGRREPGWPRHLFVQLDDVGLAYAGPVSCLSTGEMAFAHHWSTERQEDFTRWERMAFDAGSGSFQAPSSASTSRFS